MTATPAEYVNAAVSELSAAFPTWTVLAYKGYLDTDADITAYPYVTIAFEQAIYEREQEMGADRLYMLGRLVCYLIERLDSATAYQDSFNYAADILAFFRQRTLHESAQPADPVGITQIPEDGGRGVPNNAGRVIWAVEADAVLLIEESGVLSDAAFYGVPAGLPLGEQLAQADLSVEVNEHGH